jgi:hypothetical protein
MAEASHNSAIGFPGETEKFLAVGGGPAHLQCC